MGTDINENEEAKQVHVYNWLKISEKAMRIVSTLEEQEQITNELITSSNNLLTISDFLPLMDSLAPDLKPKVISKLQSQSLHLQTQKKLINDNYKFLESIRAEVKKYTSNISPQTSKFRFPCGCTFSSRAQLLDSF